MARGAAAGAPRAAGGATADGHDLESAITALVRRLEPSFVIVETDAGPVSPPARGPAPPPVSPRRLAALRVGPDRALVHLPAGGRILSVAGTPPAAADVILDAAHDLAIVRTPIATTSATELSSGVEPWAGFSYIVAFDGARGGLNARPAFVGRVDPINESRWPAPLSAIGATTGVNPGALIYAMDGRFLGMAFAANGDGISIVPPAALRSVTTVLLTGK